ncbi:peptidyl-tRNA hydrolase ICT1, mitochondrial [Venturia canescens]|uniref:peptidyl-tRNA hydrolase ICT1, mitochondrial n=1 Tax=Venturia canescens TaxID=32260 RepID=UPI001C9C6C70|nr:peptidyl-tRNA hydrolase ICT1, mitochondrial [Venturia canescens]
MNLISRQFVKIFRSDICNTSHVCSLGRNYSFKSPYAPENLYPKSTIKIFTPNFVPEDPKAKFNGFIPMDQLDVTYSKAGGPGGQHINKTNTKVDLRFNVQNATWLDNELKPKLMLQEKNRINKEGYLIIKSDLTRSQNLNLADALERLRTMIRKAAQPEPTISPETVEMLRKRHLKAVRERLSIKRARSQIKRDRQANDFDD